MEKIEINSPGMSEAGWKCEQTTKAKSLWNSVEQIEIIKIQF